ncbi:MAG: glycosyltransferase family 4 protein [Halanaerobium sp.]
MINNSKIKVSMFSSAEKAEGQGVASAYREQVELVKELPQNFEINFNKLFNIDIAHFHTIDLKHYFFSKILKLKGVSVAYVHFLPETVDSSLNFPALVEAIFFKYIIKFYQSMDYLVTVNPYFIKKLVEQGIDREKIYYIPNYVSSDNFYPYPSEQKLALRKEMKIAADDFVVLGVGQIQNRKGVLDFVEVAQNFPEVKFIWVGGFSFGRITSGYQQLKAIVDDPPDNVEFPGIVPREKMNDFYNAADLLFMPSYNELFPMSILEAMSCQLPLLLRDIPLYQEILAGYYLSAADNQGFVEEIKKLIDNQKYYQEAADISEAGNLYYSKKHVLYMWEKFYEEAYQNRVRQSENK